MESITKFIFDVIQLIAIFKIALFVTKIFTGSFRSSTKRKDNRKNSIAHRLYLLAINPIIYKLDDIIYAQKQKRLAVLKERQVSANNSNIIDFKSKQKQKNA